MSDLGEHPDERAGWCQRCRDDDHSQHRPQLAGICIGCSCPVREGDEYAGADGGDFTTVENDEKPSELLEADDLDHAMLLIVVGPGGKTRMWVDPNVDPGMIAKGLRRTARHLEQQRTQIVETVRTMLDPES